MHFYKGIETDFRKNNELDSKYPSLTFDEPDTDTFYALLAMTDAVTIVPMDCLCKVKYLIENGVKNIENTFG